MRQRNRDKVELWFGGAQKLSFALSSRGKVETRLGGRSEGSLPADKTATQVIFKLSEVVLLKEPKNNTYLIDPAFKEVSGAAVVRKGKNRRFKFMTTGPVMPDYLRALVREMSGLIKW